MEANNCPSHHHAPVAGLLHSILFGICLWSCEGTGTDTQNLPEKETLVGRTESGAYIYVAGTRFIPSDPEMLRAPLPTRQADQNGNFSFKGSLDAPYSIIAKASTGASDRLGCRENFFIPLQGVVLEEYILLDRPVTLRGILIDSLTLQSFPKVEVWIGEMGTFNYAKVAADGAFELKDVCFQRETFQALRVVKGAANVLIGTPLAYPIPACSLIPGAIMSVDSFEIPADHLEGASLPQLVCHEQ